MSVTDRRCFEHRSFSGARHACEPIRTTHTIEIMRYPHSFGTDDAFARETAPELGIARDTVTRHFAFPLAPTADATALLHDVVDDHERRQHCHEHADTFWGRDEPDERRKDGIEKTEQNIFHVKNNRRGFM